MRQQLECGVLNPVSDLPRPEARALSMRIRARAAELGFALCGITSSDPPPHHPEYREWIDAGHAGEMQYLARQEPKRGDLDAVLAGARSVVCVALNYSPSDGCSEPR